MERDTKQRVGSTSQPEEEEEEDNKRKREDSPDDHLTIFDEFDTHGETDEEGSVFAQISDESEFRRHCRKSSVRRLCDGPGEPGAFVYMEAEDLDVMSPDTGESYYHQVARDVLNRYNAVKSKSLELKQILKLNYLATFAFMSIETLDTNTGGVRAYQLAVWDKECNGHPVVGWFKDVTDHNSDTRTSS